MAKQLDTRPLMDIIEPTTLHFKASDDQHLTGSLYAGENPQVAIMVSAGTGFPRRFYRHVAAYLAGRGAIVLTYDYRGIGDSRTQELANSPIEYTDWGRLDQTAALEALEAAAPNLPLTHLSHSVGGHFIGLMPNHHKLSRHAFASVGTGSVWKHHLSSIPLELYFWWVLGPYSLLRHGYVKTGGGWTGESLPPRVYKAWRRWCSKRDYFESEIESTLSPQHYTAVTAPIHSWVFTDDPIATPETAKNLLRVYPNAPHQIHSRHPHAFDLKHIGHAGAFSRGREALWHEWWVWLSGCET